MHGGRVVPDRKMQLLNPHSQAQPASDFFIATNAG